MDSGTIKQYSITTVDNPYDQFTQFADWFLFDVTKGYNTSSMLARVALTSEQLSEAENQQRIKEAVEDILRLDLTNQYIMVTREINIDDYIYKENQQ